MPDWIARWQARWPAAWLDGAGDIKHALLSGEHRGAYMKSFEQLQAQFGRVGAEGRGGAEYAVVGPTGLVQLPAPALEVLPPGARALVEVGDGPVLLHPVEPPDGASR